MYCNLVHTVVLFAGGLKEEKHIVCISACLLDVEGIVCSNESKSTFSFLLVCMAWGEATDN
jgi:hypothetical protein